MKVLVVEDNTLLGKSVKQGLEDQDWVVDLAQNGEEACYYTDSGQYDIIVLDWMLPKISGINFLEKVRAQGVNIPVIMISAKSEVQDRVFGLEQGADDYLIKPFEMVELIARINALYRRSVGLGSSLLSIAKLTIDLADQSVKIGDQAIELTAKEYDLLKVLATKPDQLVLRTSLAGLLYPLNSEPESNSIDVLLNRLRKKIISSDVEIETVRGRGYILRVASSST